MRFGKNLAEARKKKGLSQAKLARRIGSNSPSAPL